jgi:membrane protein YqaA with SNARE-associated domain
MENFNNHACIETIMKASNSGKNSFNENRIFPYNKGRKIAFGMSLILFIAAIVSLVLVYIFVLRGSQLGFIVAIEKFWAGIARNIAQSTLLGVLYTALIGGLFFVVMPVEILFARFLAAENPFLAVLLIYLSGLAVAYTVNYFIGWRLSGVAKKLIAPRKFYKLKGTLNRYGAIAIYIFNAVPLPSQPLAAILGVFRYNKTRFYVFFLLGQLTKCSLIALWVYYF